MRMSRRSVSTGLAVALLSSPWLLAQTAAPAAPAAVGDVKPPKIAIIDMARVSAESRLGKSYASQLEALRKDIDTKGDAKQKELEAMDASIKALQDELEKQGTVISPEAQERKRQEIVKKNRDRQAFIEDSQGELQRLRERAQGQAANLQGDFQNKLKPVIDQVAKEKGIDIILDNQVALMFNKAYDISSDIVAKADAIVPATAAPPPAAAAPAPATGTPALAIPKPAGPAAPKPTPTPTPQPLR